MRRRRRDAVGWDTVGYDRRGSDRLLPTHGFLRRSRLPPRAAPCTIRLLTHLRLPHPYTHAPPQARAELPLPAGSYNLPSFLAYALYPPLYIAGPILTFNAFASQIAAPSALLNLRSTAAYLARGLGCWACLEAMTHTLWFYSVSRYRLWEDLVRAEGRPLGPLDMVLSPWWMIMLVWCKFLVIWRFFRWGREVVGGAGVSGARVCWDGWIRVTACVCDCMYV